MSRSHQHTTSNVSVGIVAAKVLVELVEEKQALGVLSYTRADELAAVISEKVRANVTTETVHKAIKRLGKKVSVFTANDNVKLVGLAS